MQKILIVDDEEALRFLISETLGLNGYQIFQACDGGEALTLIEEIKPDLMVLDALMPEITGYEVAKQLLPKKDKPIIIMLTANTNESDKMDALNSGVSYFMKKPFSPMMLLELVEKILGE